MTTFTLYPAIDLRAGRVVRLQEGDPKRMTEYSDNPAATARRWLDAGAEWLHVINLDGAFGETDHPQRNRDPLHPLALGQAGEEQRQLDVALRGQHRQQVVELKDEPDVLRPPS